jgi:hypothetical protein
VLGLLENGFAVQRMMIEMVQLDQKACRRISRV